MPASNLPDSEKLTTHHRNLFNGDSCVFFYNPEKWLPENFSLGEVGKSEARPRPQGGPFTAQAIHNYVDLLADSGIDTFLINANASRAWYPSKVIPTILDGYVRGDREFFRGHAICQDLTEPAEVERFIDRIMAMMNLYQDLLDAGVDWLAETAAACRRRGVSPWVSIRMNDYHGYKNVEGSFFNVPLLKNPEMRLKRSGYSPTMDRPKYRTGLNYEKAEVRDLMMAQIKEVVEDYDFEGLELDWWRQPLCCEPNASSETIEMMSDWLREVRALTQRRAEKTGRPYPLGLRIPGQLAALKSIGLDVETLCRDGTVDFVAPSSLWCTSWEMPHDQLKAQLGDQVAIYGVIEFGANALPALSPELDQTQDMRKLTSSHEMLRANAAGKLVLGAVGIEWYNFYCTDPARIPGLISDYTALRGIDQLESLRGLPKHYTFSMSGRGMLLPPFDIAPQLPTVLEGSWNRSFRLPMCAEPTDRGLELVIQVVLKADDPTAVLPVAFNGCWPRLEHSVTRELLYPSGCFTSHTSEHQGCNFHFPIELVKDGWNEITIENGNETALTVVCIELAIRPIET